MEIYSYEQALAYLKEHIDHFSFSSMETWERCQLQWYFRYLEHIKSRPVIAMTFGSSGHAETAGFIIGDDSPACSILVTRRSASSALTSA